MGGVCGGGFASPSATTAAFPPTSSPSPWRARHYQTNLRFPDLEGDRYRRGEPSRGERTAEAEGKRREKCERDVTRRPEGEEVRRRVNAFMNGRERKRSGEEGGEVGWM